MSSPIPRRNLSIRDFIHWSGLGRTRVYEELGSDRLHAIKIGRRTPIPFASAETWLASQPVHGAD